MMQKYKIRYAQRCSVLDSVKDAIIGAFAKLTPRQQWKNPVMFVVYLGSLLTTVLWRKFIEQCCR